MRQYVLIASLKRGAIEPPEPVSAETQSRLLQQDAILPQMLKVKPAFNGERWKVGENGIPIRIYLGQEWRLIRMLGK